MSDSLGGPSADTLAGDIVTIVIPSDGFYGAKFVPDKDGYAAVVDGFIHAGGKIGPIEKHKGVHKGDVLLEVNEISTMALKHNDVIKLIEDKNTLKKILKFVNNREYYRRKKVGNTVTTIADVRNTFYSNIKQFRYSTTGKSSKKFVEYELSCQYRVITDQVNKEIVYKWSVWKRYSQFLELHKQLLKTLGWQMDGIEFPSSNMFVYNKLSPTFVEGRRVKFVEYWQKVTNIDKIIDFQKHHSSQELKQFVQLEANTNMQVAAAVGMITEDISSPASSIMTTDNNSDPNKTSPIGRRGPLMNLNRNSRRLSGNIGSGRLSENTPTTPTPATDAEDESGDQEGVESPYEPSTLFQSEPENGPY